MQSALFCLQSVSNKASVYWQYLGLGVGVQVEKPEPGLGQRAVTECRVCTNMRCE